jgi:hypothetical protein
VSEAGRGRITILHLLEGHKNDKRPCLDKICRLRFETGTIGELSSSTYTLKATFDVKVSLAFCNKYDWIPMGEIFPYPSRPTVGATESPVYLGITSFPGVNRAGRGVSLTNHSHLTPSLKEE